MAHTKFKGGDTVRFSDAVIGRSNISRTDPKKIELFTSELLEATYKRTLETFVVKVVKCGHTLEKIAQITYSNGRTSNVIDRCLVKLN